MVWVGRDLKDHLVPTPCHGLCRTPPCRVAYLSVVVLSVGGLEPEVMQGQRQRVCLSNPFLYQLPQRNAASMYMMLQPAEQPRTTAVECC